MTSRETERVNIGSKLQESVSRFVEIIGYGRQLAVSEPYYPYDDPEGAGQYPDSDAPGCYVFADGRGTPKYVGKASRYLGNRIWAHIGRRGKSGEPGELYPNAEDWVRENQPDVAVWTVAVPDEHWWLASALEGFLNDELFPGSSRQV